MTIIPFQKDLEGRDSFSCGQESLDNYLKKYISQDIRRNLVAAFVIYDRDEGILGFYTLSNSSLPKEDLILDFQKKTGIYGLIPVTLLGRLAIDNRLKGKGYGKILLVDALKKAYEVSQTILGSFAVIVDPIDDLATNFYYKFGFIKLESGKMFLPMSVIKGLVI
jgi:predicted GNAT family N-acyltransferase